MIIRGVIESISWVTGMLRRIVASGRDSEKFRNIVLMQHFGFSSNPPANSMIAIVKNSTGPLAICVAEDTPSQRPDLSALEGASCIWSDQTHYVLIKNDGSIVIKSDQPITIESDDIKLGGDTGLRKLIDERIQVAFNGHVHFTGVSPTGTPQTVYQVPIVLGDLPGQTPVTTISTKGK